MSEIKPYPCPFCGSNKVEYQSFGNEHAIVCMICGTKGPIKSTVIEAVLSWQQRYDKNDDYQ